MRATRSPLRSKPPGSRSVPASRRSAPRGARRPGHPAPRRRAASCTATSSSSRSDAGRGHPSSVWRTAGVGVNAGRLHRGRRRDARRRLATGSTRSATSTAARCSPTWASTRRWVCIERDPRSGRRRDRRPRRLAPGCLHRAPARRGRPDARRRRGARPRRSRRRRRDRSERRRKLHRTQRRRNLAHRRRRVARACIVGATFVGPEIAESLHAATIAVAGRDARSIALRHAVPAFPTRSETWLRLLEAYGA